MNKKLLLATAMGLTMVASTALAAPLNDYSAGKVALDLGFNWSGKVDNGNGKVNTEPAMNVGLTIGLGNRLAAQYKYDNWQSKDYASAASTSQLGYQKHQLNFLYQLVPGLSPYIGLRHDRASVDSKVNGFSSNLNTSENIAQIGIVGQYKFSNRAKLWGDISIGTKNRQSYEIGLGYELIKNTDLNFTYQHNDLDGSKIYGFTTGVSYKF